MVVPERACGRNFLDWTYPHSMGIGRSGGRRRILKQRKPWTPHLEHALKCAVFLHGSLYSPFAVLCCVGLCRIWKLCIACFDTTGGSAEARGPGSSRSFAALWPQVAGSLWWCIQISTPRPPGALHCVNSGLWHATCAAPFAIFCSAHIAHLVFRSGRSCFSLEAGCPPPACVGRLSVGFSGPTFPPPPCRRALPAPVVGCFTISSACLGLQAPIFLGLRPARLSIRT